MAPAVLTSTSRFPTSHSSSLPVMESTMDCRPERAGAALGMATRVRGPSSTRVLSISIVADARWYV